MTKKVSSIPIPTLLIEAGVVASWDEVVVVAVVVVEPCLGVMRHVDLQTRYWAQEQKVVVHTHQEGCGVENNV